MKATHVLALSSLFAVLMGGLAVAADTGKKTPTIRIMPRGSIAVTSSDLVSADALGMAVGQYANEYKKRYGDPPRVGLRIELNAPVKFETLRLIAALGERVGFPHYEVVSGPFHVRLDREIGANGEVTLISKFAGEKVKKGRRFAFGGYWFESADQICQSIETIWRAAASDRPFVENPFANRPRHEVGVAPYSDDRNPFDKPAKDNPFGGGGNASDPFADPGDATDDPFGGDDEPTDPFGGRAPAPGGGDPFGSDDDPFAEPNEDSPDPFGDSVEAAPANPFRDSTEPADDEKSTKGPQASRMGGVNIRDNPGSVATSLGWLAAHQKENGSWSFDHREGGPSQADPGTLKSTRNAANKFLDSVQADGGAKYGYTAPGTRASTSAMGLVGRMFLGGDLEQEALERGRSSSRTRGRQKTTCISISTRLC